MSTSEFLSVTQAGLRVGVQRTRAYEMARANILPTVVVGGCIRVPRAAFELWLEAQTMQALANVKTPEEDP